MKGGRRDEKNRINKEVRTPTKATDFLYTKHTSEEGNILLLQLYIALPSLASGKFKEEGKNV